MINSGEVSSEMKVVLTRYIQIQAEEQKLKEEKAGLQASISAYMEKNEAEAWLPVVDGQKLKVYSKPSITIEYDEMKLRERLGDRYPAILVPDIRKIRHNLKQVESALMPMLDLVGSPSPDKVKESIEKGLTKKEEFAGAFEKTIKHKVSVMKVNVND